MRIRWAVMRRTPPSLPAEDGQQPLPAPDVADVRVTAERRLEPLVEPRAHGGRVLPQLLALHDVEVLERDRAARGVTGVRVGVHPAVFGLDAVDGVLDRT